MRWTKSSYTHDRDCVEVGINDDLHAHVRDTKDRQGPVLTFSRGDWQALVSDLRNGRLERG